MTKRLSMIFAMACGLALGACGSAEVRADEDPGEEPADLRMKTEGDITEGEVGADVDISEEDEDEHEHDH